MPGGAPEQLGGLIWWFVLGVYVSAVLLATFVALDSLKAERLPRFAVIREPRLLYTLGAAVYLAFAVIAWIPVPASFRLIAAIPVFLAPLAVVLEVAYLLRVVFPKPEADPSLGEVSRADVATDDAPVRD